VQQGQRQGRAGSGAWVARVQTPRDAIQSGGDDGRGGEVRVGRSVGAAEFDALAVWDAQVVGAALGALAGARRFD
jgi:hypothetical protein